MVIAYEKTYTYVVCPIIKWYKGSIVYHTFPRVENVLHGL